MHICRLLGFHSYKTTVEQNNCFVVQAVEQNKKDTILLAILCMQWYISLHNITTTQCKLHRRGVVTILQCQAIVHMRKVHLLVRLWINAVYAVSSRNFPMVWSNGQVCQMTD